jgi:hypothetical protein
MAKRTNCSLSWGETGFKGSSVIGINWNLRVNESPVVDVHSFMWRVWPILPGRSGRPDGDANWEWLMATSGVQILKDGLDPHTEYAVEFYITNISGTKNANTVVANIGTDMAQSNNLRFYEAHRPVAGHDPDDSELMRGNFVEFAGFVLSPAGNFTKIGDDGNDLTVLLMGDSNADGMVPILQPQVDVASLNTLEHVQIGYRDNPSFIGNIKGAGIQYSYLSIAAAAKNQGKRLRLLSKSYGGQYVETFHFPFRQNVASTVVTWSDNSYDPDTCGSPLTGSYFYQTVGDGVAPNILTGIASGNTGWHGFYETLVVREDGTDELISTDFKPDLFFLQRNQNDQTNVKTSSVPGDSIRTDVSNLIEAVSGRFFKEDKTFKMYVALTHREDIKISEYDQPDSTGFLFKEYFSGAVQDANWNPGVSGNINVEDLAVFPGSRGVTDGVTFNAYGEHLTESEHADFASYLLTGGSFGGLLGVIDHAGSGPG